MIEVNSETIERVAEAIYYSGDSAEEEYGTPWNNLDDMEEKEVCRIMARDAVAALTGMYFTDAMSEKGQPLKGRFDCPFCKKWQDPNKVQLIICCQQLAQLLQQYELALTKETT